ncbi:MAG: hypothetical protein GVY32_06780 [Gammaproteobacteria bacterium]|nr:hypothetical protein [Gammaproteobacteria bacterium]
MEGAIRLLSELKQRRTFQVAATYFVIAWLLIQAGDILLGNFGAPDWVFKTLVLMLALGFPVTLFIAWFLGESSDQARVTGGAGASAGRNLMSVFAAAAVTAMAVTLVWLVWDKFRGEPVGSDPVREASVAVLPFADMSAEGDQEYFADGLSEEILNLLAGIRELKVSGRTSSFSFKGKDVPIPRIGEQLGVAHVLEGSVRKAGDQVRVTAQLIEAEGGFHLWSETYDRRLDDIFEIQDDIAGAIAGQLKLSLIDSDGRAVSANSTDSLEAYELYLEARRLVQGRSLEGLERAHELLERALALDPDFAPALAESALTWLMRSNARITPGDIPLATALSEARPRLERALALDPRLAEGYAVGGLMNILERDFEGAESALARALELNPSQSDALNWRAINLRSSGRLREDIRARRQLAKIDPLHVSNLFNLAIGYILAGDEAAAMAEARGMRERFPGIPWGELAELEVLEAFGRLAEADRMGRRAIEAGNEVVRSAAGSVNFMLGRYEASMALAGVEYDMALLALGRVDEALAAARDRAVSSPRDQEAAHGLMHTLSLAGRHEAVLAYYEKRWGSIEALSQYFGFDTLSAEMIPVAAAQYHLGLTEALEDTMAHWRQRMTVPVDQGYDMPYFHAIRARLEALSGHPEPAVEFLARSVEGGYLDPLLQRMPSFSMLRNDPAFQRVVERNFELIDIERSKLDLPPIEREQAAPPPP